MRNIECLEAANGLAIVAPDYVNSRALAANTAEQVSVPTVATGVYATVAVIAVDAVTYVKYGTNPTAAVATDVDDGTGSEMLTIGVHRRKIPAGVTKLSFISAATTSAVTCAFYSA